ncbi:MAG: response regulator [Desulfuromonadales bacterium]|nr:response regulator [Desulfuromonadales bacterium]
MELLQSRTSYSLLIMEDDTLVCKVIGRMISLTFPDISVYTAENGQVGMELFNEHKPDIVITDINMPDMDGIQVAREIKSIKPETKFIVLTGYSDEKHLDEFREIGFNDYIVKPINFDSLFAAIEACRIEVTQ